MNTTATQKAKSLDIARSNGWDVQMLTANLWRLDKQDVRINVRFYTNLVVQLSVNGEVITSGDKYATLLSELTE